MNFTGLVLLIGLSLNIQIAHSETDVPDSFETFATKELGSTYNFLGHQCREWNPSSNFPEAVDISYCRIVTTYAWRGHKCAKWINHQYQGNVSDEFCPGRM